MSGCHNVKHHLFSLTEVLSFGGKKFGVTTTALSPGYLILQSLMKKGGKGCSSSASTFLVPEFRKNYFLNNGHNSCKEMGTSEKSSVRLLVGNAPGNLSSCLHIVH